MVSKVLQGFVGEIEKIAIAGAGNLLPGVSKIKRLPISKTPKLKEAMTSIKATKTMAGVSTPSV